MSPRPTPRQARRTPNFKALHRARESCNIVSDYRCDASRAYLASACFRKAPAFCTFENSYLLLQRLRHHFGSMFSSMHYE